jgi:hypothetical protein
MPPQRHMSRKLENGRTERAYSALTSEEIRALDARVAQLGTSRSDFLRQLIRAAVVETKSEVKP